MDLLSPCGEFFSDYYMVELLNLIRDFNFTILTPYQTVDCVSPDVGIPTFAGADYWYYAHDFVLGKITCIRYHHTYMYYLCIF